MISCAVLIVGATTISGHTSLPTSKESMKYSIHIWSQAEYLTATYKLLNLVFVYSCTKNSNIIVNLFSPVETPSDFHRLASPLRVPTSLIEHVQSLINDKEKTKEELERQPRSGGFVFNGQPITTSQYDAINASMSLGGGEMMTAQVPVVPAAGIKNMINFMTAQQQVLSVFFYSVLQSIINFQQGLISASVDSNDALVYPPPRRVQLRPHGRRDIHELHQPVLPTAWHGHGELCLQGGIAC